MRLIIKNPNNLDLDEFCDYLIQYLQNIYFNIQNFDAKLVEQWNRYLGILFPDIHITLEYLIEIFFENQIYYKKENDYIITVDKVVNIQNVPIERIAQTIQDGILGIQGFDIFEQLYQEIANQVGALYTEWEANK